MATKAWREANIEKMREYRREWYRRNKEHAVQEVMRYHKELSDWFREFKTTLKCLRCGENDPACLDFHHRDGKEKDRAVSKMLKYGKKKLLAEIAKCDVLCSNCHRKFHYRGVADWNAAVSKIVA